MTTPIRFHYRSIDTGAPQAKQLAYLPVVLSNSGISLAVAGLLDTGSTVNVLPFSAGLQLGLLWEEQTTRVQLTGTLSRLPSRGVVLTGAVDAFPPVDLVFAWTQSEDVPVLFGQVNFFMEFDVCFFRSLSMFEVSPKRSSRSPSQT